MYFGLSGKSSQANRAKLATSKRNLWHDGLTGNLKIRITAKEASPGTEMISTWMLSTKKTRIRPNRMPPTREPANPAYRKYDPVCTVFHDLEM